MSRHALTVIVATSTNSLDDAIERYCRDHEISYFRGDEHDVLDRYHRCAEKHGFSHVVRLTADNPFTDIEELDRLIDLHLTESNAFTHAFGQLPIGVGAEIFSFEALHQSWLMGHEKHHREHVDEYLLENPQIFKTGLLAIHANKICPDLRLTVDTEADWEKADKLVSKSADKWLTTERILELCSASV